MKAKIILCLALVLSGIFATQCAYGFVSEVQINHTNLIKDYSFLQINTVRIHYTNNETILFTVTVTPKEKQQSEHFEGFLKINDTNIGGHGFIAQTSVGARMIPKALRSKSISFQFLVSAKYLETSEFRVEETYGELDGAPVDYIFNLKEFADEK
ncbi:MAG: hypothetical protein ABSC01_07285 [Verrucomicrobiota bacterium]|jgi:hypothetical protein